MIRVPLLPSAVCLGVLLVLGSLGSLNAGVMSLPLADSMLSISDRLFGGTHSTLAVHEQAIILELRLPRTLLAVLVGAMLAQCGAVMQGMFRNPLADPGIIGVSAGAAVGAVLAIYLSPAPSIGWTVPIAAFCAGLATSLLIYRLARSSLGTSVLVLLLAGIAISALAGSLIGLVTYIADDNRLRDLTLWQMGSVAGADSLKVWLALLGVVVLGTRFQQRARALNALLLGEAEARHLGINVEALKRELVVLVALGVGLAVACAGIVGFVGLVVPHMVRSIAGPGHRCLLPLSALGGGLLLLLADIVARIVVPPAELPVGLVTALLGAPFFIVLLMQYKRRV